MAMGGYVEFLTMALLSHKDMFTNLLKEKKMIKLHKFCIQNQKNLNKLEAVLFQVF